MVDSIIKEAHRAYYPFSYNIKWEMSRNRTEFGKILREKWDAICKTITDENDIWLDEYFLTSAFDCVYFSLKSSPKLAPQYVVDAVKFGVCKTIIQKHPDLKQEMLSDSWYLIHSESLEKIDNVAYYFRFYLKGWLRGELSRSSQYRPQIEKSINDVIVHTVDEYCIKKGHAIELFMLNLSSDYAVEIIVGCPIIISTSDLIKYIKGASSYYIRNVYVFDVKEVKELIIERTEFWSGGNFIALSRKQVETISTDRRIYEVLKQRWDELRKEMDKMKKGKELESFCVGLITAMKNFEILRDENGKYNINLGFEEIDITVINKSKLLERFGPLFKIECKNYAKPIGNDEIRDFSGKLRGEIRLGLLISVNGFGKFDKELIDRLALRERKIIVQITGDEISEWLGMLVDGFDRGSTENTIEKIIQDKIFRTWLYYN